MILSFLLSLMQPAARELTQPPGLTNMAWGFLASALGQSFLSITGIHICADKGKLSLVGELPGPRPKDLTDLFLSPCPAVLLSALMLKTLLWIKVLSSVAELAP